jgi:hypothetical protein
VRRREALLQQRHEQVVREAKRLSLSLAAESAALRERSRKARAASVRARASYAKAR